MSSRNAKIIVSILMLASLLVIIMSATGLLGSANQTSDSNGTSDQTENTDPVITSATSAIELHNLIIKINEPEPTPATGLRRWPAESLLPAIQSFDSADYLGRPLNQKPLDGITVILDPGHGGQDGGTIYPDKSSDPIILEKNITLAIGLKARSLLEALGAEVIMTRNGDDWKSLYNRISQVGIYALERFKTDLPTKGYNTSVIDHLQPQLETMIEINSDNGDSGGRDMMKGAGANNDSRLLFDVEQQYQDTLFISLHCNALSNASSVRGAQVYYETVESCYEAESQMIAGAASTANSPAYTLYNDAGRERLATLLRDNFLIQQPEMKFTGEHDLLPSNYAVLREMNVVNALIEMGFVTNESDRQILLDPNGQQKIAQAVTDAVYAYYCQ